MEDGDDVDDEVELAVDDTESSVSEGGLDGIVERQQMRGHVLGVWVGWQVRDREGRQLAFMTSGFAFLLCLFSLPFLWLLDGG